MRKEKVVICLAHNYPMFMTQFVFSLLRMIDTFYKEVDLKKYELLTIMRGGYALDDMRNFVVRDALELKADYLLFLDTDMIFPAQMIGRMLSVLKANKKCEAVTGVYTWKKDPYCPQLFSRFDTKIKKFRMVNGFILDKPFWLGAAGMGVVMVKASVFKKHKEPWFKFVKEGEDKRIPLGLGEDLHFFWKCKPKLLCDPTITPGHYDTRPVGLENYINKNGLEVKDNKIIITKKQALEIDKKHNKK